MRLGATALLLLCLTAPALTQAPTPQVDRALVITFVQASDAERTALLAEHPELYAPAYREILATQGNAQRQNGELDVAELFYRALLFVARQRSGDPSFTSSESVAYNNLAIVAGARGDLPQATAFVQRAMQLAEQAGQPSGVQSAWANLGIIQRKLGELDLAEASMRRAMAMADPADHLSRARSLNNLGLLYKDRGDLATAQELYLQSLQLKEENDASAREQSSTLTNLGGLFDEQGDRQQALYYYTRGYDLLIRAGVPESAMSSALNNLGHVYAALGQHAEASAFFRRALAVSERSGERVQYATILYNLADIEQAAGRLDEAESLARRALEAREQLSDRVGLVESLTSLSHLMLHRGQPEASVPLAERAVSLSTASRLLNQLWKAQFSLGHALAAAGRLDDAAAAYAASIQTIEDLRRNAAGGDSGRRAYLFERVGPYYGLATIKASAGDGWGALAVMEQSRARALTDIIARGRQPMGQLDEGAQRQEHALLQAIAAASDALDTEAHKRAPDAARLDALETSLRKARVARDVFTNELYAREPNLGFARGNINAITRESLDGIVTPSTAVITFVFDSEGPWVYLIRRTGADVTVTTRKLSIGTAALTSKAEAFTAQVASRDLGFAGTARALYADLIGPIDELLTGTTDIVLIPDGPLWSVPFQALITSRGHFLLEERAVSYSPSLSALQALESRRAARSQRPPFLLALGDPITSAPGTTAVTRGALGGLPHAAREVRSLGDLYGAGHSRVLTAAAASESALRANLSRATVVHLATHGILDDASPMYSRVLLSGDPQPSAASQNLVHTADGRLEAWEILDMGFTADLAVLSACKTARGRFGWGEGVIGLSWSLFAAGASTAVVSQWEVDSASTTQLMIAFHRQRLRSPAGRSAADANALRTAALSVMKDPAYRHPFYWAGFIVVGAR